MDNMVLFHLMMKYILMHIFSTTDNMYLKKFCYPSTDDIILSVSATPHYSSKQIYKIHIQILAIRKLLVLNVSLFGGGKRRD